MYMSAILDFRSRNEHDNWIPSTVKYKPIGTSASLHEHLTSDDKLSLPEKSSDQNLKADSSAFRPHVSKSMLSSKYQTLA